MKFRGVTSKVKTSSCSPSCSGMWANETCMKQNPKGKRRRVWPCAGKDEAMRHQSNSCWIAASLWPTVPTLLSMWKQLPKMQSMCPQCHLNCQVFRKKSNNFPLSLLQSCQHVTTAPSHAFRGQHEPLTLAKTVPARRSGSFDSLFWRVTLCKQVCLSAVSERVFIEMM